MEVPGTALDAGRTGEGQRDQVLTLRVAFEKKQGNIQMQRVILDINKPPEQRVKGPGGGRADSSRAGLREAPVEATLAWGPGMEEEGP